MAFINIYILTKTVINPEEKYFDILGAYKNKYKAIDKQNFDIKDNIDNYGFIENNESEILVDGTTIFYQNQNNWKNYISYSLEKVVFEN